MRTDESRIPSRAREVLAHVRSLGILSAWLGILGISGQLGAGLGMAGHFLGGSTREREERGEDGPGGDAERQDICCKCQVLALTWRSLVCLGAAWHGCSAVSGLAEGRCGRGAQGPGWRCCVALCRAHGPLDLWRLHQQVRPAGGRLARLANGRRLASEPRLPRVCQALRQCYCHEREGVIKTERPAVLVKSAVDQFSPLHHLEALQQSRQFVAASFGFVFLPRSHRPGTLLCTSLAGFPWHPSTPAAAPARSLWAWRSCREQSSSARRSW